MLIIAIGAIILAEVIAPIEVAKRKPQHYIWLVVGTLAALIIFDVVVMLTPLDGVISWHDRLLSWMTGGFIVWSFLVGIYHDVATRANPSSQRRDA